jgi:hypothetical protein
VQVLLAAVVELAAAVEVAAAELVLHYLKLQLLCVHCCW